MTGVKIESSDTVVITGASGGLGIHMVRAFAKRGVRLALVAFPGAELKEPYEEAVRLGCEAEAFPCDLRRQENRQELVRTVLQRFGRVDLLVNNAGVEYTSYYHQLGEDKILDVLRVNLEAPMILTRLLLPQMLDRKRGHVVNISSLAGKSGPAFQESYSASKAALVAFTSSLRGTYRHSGFSASVIVPGFIDAGIYSNLKARAGGRASWLLGSMPPEAVARAVTRAVEQDCPEIIVNQLPVRPLLALATLSPRFGEWLTDKTGSNDFFRRVVQTPAAPKNS